MSDKPDKSVGETEPTEPVSGRDVKADVPEHLPGGAARVARAANKATDDIGVPKLPRGRGGFSMSMGQFVKIAFTAGVLVMVLVIQQPCSDAVSGFVTDMDGKGSNAATKMPKPDNLQVPRGSQLDTSTMESLRPGMSDAEVKAAIDRARAKAAGNAVGSGSEIAVPALFAPW